MIGLFLSPFTRPGLPRRQPFQGRQPPWNVPLRGGGIARRRCVHRWEHKKGALNNKSFVPAVTLCRWTIEPLVSLYSGPWMRFSHTHSVVLVWHCFQWYFKHYFLPVLGGCAAQEVIKLITKQYVPLDNTFIFNSVSTTTATLRL